MKNIIITILFSAFLYSCNSKKQKANDYFTDNQRDTLLKNIITYIYIPAPQATNETKFQPQFRGFYAKNITKFNLQNYYQA
ncbi:MAG: hypothetical protein RLZZ306_2034, partial [Bacteroidota bacterium]